MSWLDMAAERTIAGTFALGLASGLGAQELSVNTWAEAGGDESYSLFLELGLARTGLGIQPVATLGGYLAFGDGESAWGATPAVGVKYQTNAGFLRGRLGWGFRDELALPYFGGNESGLYTSLDAEFWGDVYNAMGIVDYHWGGEYLWTHARLGRGMDDLAEGGSWGLGVELIYQAQAEDPSPLEEGFSATQLGPVLQWTPGADRPMFFFSGGWKRTELGLFDENTWYLRGEIRLPR